MMHCWLLTVVYLSLTVYAFEQNLFFFDQENYNPCQPNSGVYYYPHPTDMHQYYQCDDFGVAYLRSCGSLVWDDVSITCNWPSAVAPRPPPTEPSSSSTTTTTSTTAEETTATTAEETTATTAEETTATTAEETTATTAEEITTAAETITTTATVAENSTINRSSPSLCSPINPCGEHGECIESFSKASTSRRRRFACICDDKWFGRLCDQHISSLTTPVLSHDQPRNDSQDTFSLPVYTEEDSKYIFYGLKPSEKIEEVNSIQQRMMDPKFEENDDKRPQIPMKFHPLDVADAHPPNDNTE